MSCYHPFPAWITHDGEVVFVEPGDFFERIELPCRNCIGCRLDRSGEWMIRITHEAQMHELKVFLTLTYNDENLPFPPTLVKKHFQDFLKRLRRHHEYNHGKDAKLRFHMCGEYGETTDRPHYHAIIFGCDFSDKKPHSRGSQGHQIYISKKLDELWGKGHCYIGSVTPESAGYVARYIMKKVNGDRADEHYKKIDPRTGEVYQALPEYTQMSLKPGLGATWFEKYRDSIFPSDFTVIKGKQKPIPEYYDKLLARYDEDALESVKELRKEKAKKTLKDQTPARRKVREEVKKSKIKKLIRSL